jgi:uncharacterized repeat protein (TIGR03803 family)
LGALAIAFMTQWISMAAHASSLSTVYSFCDNIRCKNGVAPAGRLMRYGSSAQFYGTTAAVTVADRGTVFRVGIHGSFRSLIKFCSKVDCTDGDTAGHYLAESPDGYVYGTTQRGGGSGNGGTLFKISPKDEFSTAYTFCSKDLCLDGSSPVGVTFDSAGNMFGTTIAGGAHREGTLFEMTAAGKYKVIHDFCALAICADGNLPGAVTAVRDGYLYGVTTTGGASNGGTIFAVTPEGRFETLYSFCKGPNCLDGQQPNPVLVEGHDRNIYGTTLAGGGHGHGVVFQITPRGEYTILHSFCAQEHCADGNNVQDGLSVAQDGSLYGTTAGGGTKSAGTIFRITPKLAYSVVYNFCSLAKCKDGASPESAPVVGYQGLLYGTTNKGGENNTGSIYRFTP